MADSTNGVTRFGEEWFTQEQIDEKRNDSLQLSRINKNGKLGEMIDIINSNFREIAMHGGGPAGVDGTSGLDGEDGLNVEYIYALSDEMKAGVNYPVGDDRLYNLFTLVKNSGSSVYESTVWYDTAQPISKEHKNEYVLRRYRRSQDSSEDSEGQWTYDPNPVLWSHWGESGQDGNGVEYIYILRESKMSEADEDRSLLKREHMDDSQKVIFDIDGFFPGAGWFSENEEDKKELVTSRLEAYGLVFDTSRWSDGYGLIVEGYDWKDGPLGTGDERRYEYVSIRKSSTDENDRKIWGDFEKPVLWSSYSSSKFTAFAFTVSEPGVNLGNSAPLGGSYENPVPGPMTYDGKTYEWTDIIDTGSSGDNAVVWMTSSVMKDDDGYVPVWSRPVRITVEGGTDIIVRDDEDYIDANVEATDPVSGRAIARKLDGKQDKLTINGTELEDGELHFKTINGDEIVGEGNIIIQGGEGGGTVTIDEHIDQNSVNPVQNKAIYEALEDKADTGHTHTTAQITDWNNATSQFLTSHQDISGKQDKLTPGQNITIDENNVISASGGGGSVVVDSTLNDNSVNPVQNKVIATALNAKADASSVPTKTSDLQNDSGFITSADVPSGSSNFIGTFASANDLPQNASDGNYAYVGASAPYSIYSYDSSRTPKWNATGATADTNTLTADEEDITASETGVLSLKNRDTSNGKGIIRIRKNPQTILVIKKYTVDSNFIGTFASADDLLEFVGINTTLSANGKFAYVGTSVPYKKYSYSSSSNPKWHDTGETVNINSPIYVHAVEDTARGESDATTSAGYNSKTMYYHGCNPAAPVTDEYGTVIDNSTGLSLYGKEIGFPNPLGTTHKKSVRKSSPKVILNTTDNKFYFSWKYNSTSRDVDGDLNIWGISDICFDEWYDKPEYYEKYGDLDFVVKEGNVFACVENGITHYYLYTNGRWEKDEKEEKTVNLVTQSDFNVENTIYEITYDINLNGALITIPKGCTLKYAGGKIMNGAINMTNDTHIDCPDVQFFEEVQLYNAYADVMKDVWFDNIWYAMSGEKRGEQTFSTISQISLSKNYTLDFKYFNFIVYHKTTGSKNDLFHIIGNNNRITISTIYMPGGCFFVKSMLIQIEDLEITEKQFKDARYLPTEFNCLNTLLDAYNVKLNNFKYMGYSRCIENSAQTTIVNSGITLINCDIRVQSFAFECNFNAVVMKHTKIDFIDGANGKTYYGGVLISIGACAGGSSESDVQWFRYYADIQDCYIGGSWELNCPKGIANDDNQIYNVKTCNTTHGGVAKYLSYPWMKFKNCTFMNFTLGNQDANKNGLGNTDITFEGCHFRNGSLLYTFNRVNDITFNHCEMDMISYNSGVAFGSFGFTGVNSVTLNGCTIRKTTYKDTNNDITYGIPSNALYFIRAFNTRSSFRIYLYGNRFIPYKDPASGTNSCDFKIGYHNRVNNADVALASGDISERTIMAGNYFVPEYSSSHCVYAVAKEGSLLLPVNDTVIDSTIMQYSFGAMNMSLCPTDFTVTWRTENDSSYYAGNLARGYYSAVLGKFLFVRENTFPYSYYESTGSNSSVDGLTLFYRKKGMARAGDVTWAKITNGSNTLCNKQLIYDGNQWLSPELNDWRLKKSGTSAVMEEMKKYASELGTTFFNTSDSKMYYLSSVGTFPTFTITINDGTVNGTTFYLHLIGNSITNTWSQIKISDTLSSSSEIAEAIVSYFNNSDHNGNGYEIVDMSCSGNVITVICNVRTTGVSCYLKSGNGTGSGDTSAINYTISTVYAGSPGTWTAF